VAKAEKAKEAKTTKKDTGKSVTVKKTTSRKPAPQGKPNFFQRTWTGLRRYFNETMGELRKVTWPTRQEAMFLTRIVIVVVVVMSIALGSLDFIYSQLIGLILSIR
jgi:preprotein translocase subunit SecE